jgi:integrase
MQTLHRLPIAWTMEEMGLILAACAATPGMVGEIPARMFWTALILLLFDTGLRLRAALSIERSNLDLATGWLCIAAETQKQKTEQRFQVSVQTTDAILAIWSPPRRLLFPWTRTGRRVRIWVCLGNILKRAGLPSGRRDKFHKFRRTTASHIAAAAGIDAASRQLGHSATDVTLRYIDPRIARAHIDGAAWLPRPSVPRTLPGEERTPQPPCDQLCLPPPQPEGFES